MSKIKSAIELAMERTKDLVMDEEERKSFTMKETESKVRAVAKRYLEGLTESNGVTKEMNEIAGDEKTKRSVFIDLFIDEFDIKTKNERLLELFNIIGGGLREPFKTELESMQKSFNEQMDRREITARGKIEGRLREMGITGNGIEPNIREWDEWHESMIDAEGAFKARIGEWKNRLKAADSL